ncbi:MAG: hypothetical protein JWM10_5386 [Myxococcaceae bacterium]|nr:hypothetical protein [Myxococcaceae bacterium]
MVPLPLRVCAAALLMALPRAATAQPWVPPTRPAPTLGTATLVLDERPAPGRVLLRLRSPARPQHVVIESRGAPAVGAQPGPTIRAAGACNTPCQLWVPRGTLRLRSTAPGLRATDLDLDLDLASVVELRAPSRAMFNIGTGLAALGATIMVATVTVALVQQVEGVSASDQLRPTVAVGLSLLGALILGGGVPLLVAHRVGYRQTPLAAP